MEEREAKGLFMNSAKSVIMPFSKSDVIYTCKITVHGTRLDPVEQDVRRRITIAKLAFILLEKVPKNWSVNFQLRYNLLKCYV